MFIYASIPPNLGSYLGRRDIVDSQFAIVDVASVRGITPTCLAAVAEEVLDVLLDLGAGLGA